MSLQFRNRTNTILYLLALYIAFGFIVLYSASEKSFPTLIGQSSKIVFGFILMLLLKHLPMRYIKDFVEPLYLFSIFILMIVFLVGSTGKGATRWLNLGIIKFQPSELIKLTLPLMLAKILSENRQQPNFILAIFSVIVPMILILLQPDLGTALMITFISCIMIYSAGIPSLWIKLIASLGMITAPAMWFYVLRDYQKARIFNFINPELDPHGSGYNIIQSKIAVGSGGIIGQGWLHGTQIHLKFLPEHATDFIFGVIAQEFGLLGCLLVIGLIAGITYQIILFCYSTNDRFSQLLSIGMISHFILSAFINIGMVIGILPVVGIPLSLISYAGTHNIIILIGFGMILSCIKTNAGRLNK
ncbi:MAG: rod shape-determining protein RodA [Pseudomonadota bacterium]|nr:rod shape-determining protein RodA [Pseudomonadota bacterium]